MTLRNTEWTPEEDARLRELWAAKVPASEISSRVGHGRKQVYIRAYHIGLPKRLQGWVGPRFELAWSAEADATLRRLWVEGLGEMAIGIELDISRERVRRRAKILRLSPRSRQTRRISKTVTLKCLRCQSPFPSIDRRANRVCIPCKERKSWRRGDFIYNTEHGVML